MLFHKSYNSLEEKQYVCNAALKKKSEGNQDHGRIIFQVVIMDFSHDLEITADQEYQLCFVSRNER